MQLKPFQETGVEFLASRRSALLADEMGLGKTAQAIKAADFIKAKSILVVCPASLKLNWSDEFKKWSREWRDMQIVTGSSAQILGSPVTIINYDLLQYDQVFNQLSKMQWDVGIFDEAHYLKNRSTTRTRRTLCKYGLVPRCYRRWFLTGTPVLNRPIELFPLLRVCAAEVLGPYIKYEDFAKQYCRAYWNGFQLDAKGHSNTKELNQKLSEHFMLRRTKKEVLPELPDKTYQILPMQSSYRKLDLAVAKEFEWGTDEAKKMTMGLAGGELALLRHDLALVKVDTAVELIKNTLRSKEKLVVWAHHRDVIAALETALREFNPVVLHGGTPQKHRHENVASFQGDSSTRLFIGQIQAAGVGLTLTAADQCLFVETSWVPGEVQQAADRLHRIGQLNNVLIQFLVIERSLEEHMLRTLIDKQIVINQIVENPNPRKDVLS